MEITIRNVTKYINKRLILCNVNLMFVGGVVYGLQGPNGAGKTMLMRLVAGLIRPSEGTVLINDSELGKEFDFPNSVGILLEQPAFLPSYTGLKNLELLAAIQKKVSRQEIREVLSLVGLDPDDNRKYRKYSLGMKQRLGIAAAIMEKPELILLDEPTNALDEDGIEMVRDVITEERKRGAIVIVACHDPVFLSHISDEILSVNDGIIHKKVVS